MIAAFCIPGEPVGKGRPRFNSQSGRTYTPSKTANYEMWVRECCREGFDGFFPPGTPLKVDIFAFFPVPASDSRVKRKKKLSGEIKPTKKPDFDNLGKIICDAINHIAYGDDCQITDARVVKRYGSRAFVQVYITEDTETHE